MKPPPRPLIPLCLAAALGAGCATQQLRFRPMAGVPPEEAALLRQGRFNVPPQRLFDAAAATLEHEPYFHWDISLLDKANGFIKASAGLFREVQLRVSPAADLGGGATGSILSVSVPRRALTTRAKIWILPDGALTAYEAPAALRSRSRVVSADVALDDLYFYSFTWHVLHDQAEVPFRLRAYGAPDPPAAAAPLPLRPLALPAATPLSPTGSPDVASPPADGGP